MAQSLLPLSLAFIMFTVGLALVPDDFKRVLREPATMGFGLVCQMLLLPIIAFALAAAFNLSPAFAVGLIILAASPGGVTSNFLTAITGGNSALSVSLTAVTSLLGVLTVPLIVNLGLIVFMGENGYQALPVGSMVIGLFLISTLPLLAGMLLVNYQSAFVSKYEPAARKIAGALFLMIVLATFAGQWGSISEFFVEVGPAVLALNIVTMGVAILGARQLKLARKDTIAISLECGLQNAAMGILVAATLMQNSDMVIPSVVYALVMNLSAAVFIAWMRAPVLAVPASGR